MGSHVLIVDDDPDAAGIVREVLEKEGWQVTTAHNGREALDLLTHGVVVHLILLDLVMPVMNGVELLRILKSYTRLAAIPVVVFSGHDPAAHFDMTGKFAGYLSKPVTGQELLATVRRVLPSTI